MTRLMRFVAMVICCWCVAAISNAAPGDLDMTFGVQGKVMGGSGYAGGLAIQPDGKIVLGGNVPSAMGGDQDMAALRLNLDGSLDAGFGAGSVASMGVPGSNQDGFHAALQSDGKVILVGRMEQYSTDRYVLVRFHPDGQPDGDFGQGGKALVPQAQWLDLKVLPDDKILLCGTAGDTVTSGRGTLLQANADGSLDPSFGNNGVVSLEIPGRAVVNAVGANVQADGKIVVAGYVPAAGGNNDFMLARCLADGTLDTSFGNSGFVINDFDNGNDLAADVVIQPDGKIVAGGISGAQGAFATVVRYLPNGALDTTFGVGGRASLEIPFQPVGPESWFYLWRNVALQQNGKIILSGYITYSPANVSRIKLVRFDKDGALDLSFGVAGSVTTEFAPGQSDCNGLAVQSDGKIVVTGSAYSYAGGFIPQGGYIALRYEGDPTSATVLVNQASAISQTSATLSGSVNPSGKATTAFFEYGITNAYGSTASVTLSSVDGTSPQALSVGLANLTPGTTYHYRLTAINDLGTVSTTRSVFKTWNALNSWRFDHFGSGENTNLSADTFDYDSDGLPNLLEWACGLNPTTGSRLSHETALHDGVVEFSYTRSLEAVNAGALFQVEWSDSLLTPSWSTGGVTQTIISQLAGTQQVKASLPAGSTGRRFVRLKVVAP